MNSASQWGPSLLFAVVFAAGTGAIGQEYPNRPVRLLVGYAPGGGMDTIARTVGPKLAGALNHQFIVENRPGASGGVAAEGLVNALPDGHVLMVAESGTLALPAVNPSVKLDPVKQFAPVGGIASLPMAFVVNPAFPAKNAQELIAELKARPRKYTYASPGVGSLQHLAFELFKRSAGVDAIHVPYKGATTMMPDIMNGQVPIGVISVLAAQGPSKAGRIRTLAVTAPQRVPSMPEWPALAETLPGFSASPNVFLVAPAGTPAPVVQKLSTALRAALASKDVGETFAKQGAVLTPSSAPELGQRIAEEAKRWAAVVKEAGIKVE
jgi:tripartite-type tricarboxylate transporter receptor subunit TctC